VCVCVCMCVCMCIYMHIESKLSVGRQYNNKVITFHSYHNHNHRQHQSQSQSQSQYQMCATIKFQLQQKPTILIDSMYSIPP
jgi:hypothetical protein